MVRQMRQRVCLFLSAVRDASVTEGLNHVSGEGSVTGYVIVIVRRFEHRGAKLFFIKLDIRIYGIAEKAEQK